MATIITLFAIAALIFGFVVFGPAMFSTTYEDRGLDKYVNNSEAGNSTVIAADGMNSLFTGFYSGPLQILLTLVGIFLVIAALAFAISINRKRNRG